MVDVRALGLAERILIQTIQGAMRLEGYCNEETFPLDDVIEVLNALPDDYRPEFTRESLLAHFLENKSHKEWMLMALMALSEHIKESFS